MRRCGLPGQTRGSGSGRRLCLLTCTAAGSPPERALAPAVAVELLHNFSLVHDDIQDRLRVSSPPPDSVVHLGSSSGYQRRRRNVRAGTAGTR